MEQLGFDMARLKSDKDRNDEGGKKHGYSQWLPQHGPAKVLDKPENNVQIFNFTETEWHGILWQVGGWHFVLIFLTQSSYPNPAIYRMLTDKYSNIRDCLHELFRSEEH